MQNEKNAGPEQNTLETEGEETVAERESREAIEQAGETIREEIHEVDGDESANNNANE